MNSSSTRPSSSGLIAYGERKVDSGQRRERAIDLPWSLIKQNIQSSSGERNVRFIKLISEVLKFFYIYF
uniref:Uncharacterized protein n=1 Tax=Cucumis melo TaxID=3656 RepID=A0A9I9EJ98_CUCME